MSKKTKTSSKDGNDDTGGAVAVESSPGSKTAVFDPFQRLHVADWFDRWPDIFARRWPESFQDVPLVGAGFRMEQSVDDDGTLIVRGELPGLDPESDVTITIVDNRLSIDGKREEKTEETTNGTRRSEFRYGSFHRSVSLPAGARRDAIAATYKKGILEVRVPVDVESSSVATIPITTSD